MNSGAVRGAKAGTSSATAPHKRIAHMRRMGIAGVILGHGSFIAIKLIGFVIGGTLLIYVPRLKAISNVFVLFAGFHLLGLAVVLASLYALGGRAVMRRRPKEAKAVQPQLEGARQRPAVPPALRRTSEVIVMKKFTCPCGSEFRSHSDDELVEMVTAHAKTFHNRELTREHILEEAVVVGQEPAVKKVVCPRCGAEFTTHDDDELVQMVQTHARTMHHTDHLSRELILRHVLRGSSETIGA